MHVCPDEIAVISALVASLPVLGPWLRARLSRLTALVARRHAGPTE